MWVIAASGSHEHGSHHVRIIHLISTGTSAHLVDAPPAATSEEDLSPGDTVVFTENLSSHGDKVGSDHGLCTFVAGSVAHCQATLQLSDGKIVAAGAFDFAAAGPTSSPLQAAPAPSVSPAGRFGSST